jgi:hypothetical protein
MSLTKTERNAIYRELLEKSSKPNFNRKDFEALPDDDFLIVAGVPGLCWALNHMGHYVYEDGKMQELFPELYAQKPKRTVNAWWWKIGDWKPRNEALRKAIEQTTEQINR